MAEQAALSPAWPAGINAVVFYAPVLFSSLGMGQDVALLSSVITGAVFVAATIISILTVDTFGRRVRALLSCSVVVECILIACAHSGAQSLQTAS